jgi:aminomethyltransferase
MNLYGQDMDETVSPWEAGAGLDRGARRGARLHRSRRAEAQQMAAVRRARCRPRAGRKGRAASWPARVTDRGEGEILSGTFSPTLGKSIAFARVPAGAAGGALAVDIRGKALPVRAVKFPFVRDGQPCAGI